MALAWLGAAFSSYGKTRRDVTKTTKVLTDLLHGAESFLRS